MITAIKDIFAPEPATCRRTAQHVIHSDGSAHEAIAGLTRSRHAFAFAITLLLACSSLMIGARSARASDFWDELRTPGLAAQRAHLRLGRAALRGNRADVALAEADLALARCASCADGNVLRGRALAELGRHIEAVACFERATALHAQALDDDALDALTAAFSASVADRPALAVSVLERVLARSVDQQARAQAIVMLADALQAEGPTELRRAIVTYREAMIDDDARKHALLGLALALDRQGEHQEALALARGAGTEAGPNSAGKWLAESERAARLGLWSTAIGDLGAAEQAWQRAAQSAGPWRAHADKAREAVHHAADKP